LKKNFLSSDFDVFIYPNNCRWTLVSGKIISAVSPNPGKRTRTPDKSADLGCTA